MRLPRARSLVAPAAAVLGLTTFAIAQPLLGLLGDNATFFVAHGAEASDIVGFALVVYLIPPIVVGVVVGVIGLVDRRAGRVALAAAAAVLGAVAVIQVLPAGLLDRTAVWLLIAVGSAVLIGVAMLRTTHMIGFWQWLGYASPIVVVLFLGFSPASDIVFADEVTAVGEGATSDADVVMVVLDELSLASVVGPDGQVDAARAPNFARLGDVSTFHANTTTVSMGTRRSLPSMLAGEIPGQDQLPIASQFPQNLFTVFAPTHRLVVDESVTQLCPEALCDGSHVPAGVDEPVSPDPEPVDSALLEDARVVYLHTLLPTAWADELLPTVSDRWAGFGDDGDDGPPPTSPAPVDSAVTGVEPDVVVVEPTDQIGRAERFVAALGTGDEPTLHYLHLNLPHLPFRYLPDDLTYNGDEPAGIESGPGGARVWADDPALVDSAGFRYQLQVAYADQIVGRVLDRLEATGRLDDTTLIVASDHGVAHAPGLPRRMPTDETLGDIAWVPLFVKGPGPVAPARSEVPAQLIDLLPTVAALMGVELESEVDGVDLAHGPVSRIRQITETPDLVIADEPALDDARARVETVLVSGEGAAGSYGWDSLHGATGESVPVSPSQPDPSVEVVPRRPDLLAAVDPSSGFVPALFEADVQGADAGDHLAVAVDGVLAGSGPVAADGTTLVVMLDPRALVAAARPTLTAYRIDGSNWHPVGLPTGPTHRVEFDDSGAVVSVSGPDGTWVPGGGSGSIDVRPGDRPGDEALLAGWAAHCGDGLSPVDVLVVVDDELVAAGLERRVRDDITCLDGPAEVGFAVRLAPWVIERSDSMRVIALFPDGSLAVIG